MRICPEFETLIPQERVETVGKTIHILQCSTKYYNKIQALIKAAEKEGLFTGITINPPTTPPVELNNNKNDLL